MKDVTKRNAESGRPSASTLTAVSYCLKKLYADQNKSVRDLVAVDLTYEELIGALLRARDLAEKHEDV